jgi:predicted nucleotidyltransferase
MSATNKNIKIIAQYLGGSHMYGLNTPASDEDIRYVFLTTDLGSIIGLDRFDHIDTRNKEEDKFGMELRGLFNLLRKTNTQVLELLYAKETSFTVLDSEFKRLVLDQRDKFIDSDKFYKSLKGYIFTERRLTLGERAGQIGGKRFEQVKKYGYSPKNMVQLFRLPYAGMEFFKSGEFPTNIKDYDSKLWEQLMEIKTQPEKFTANELVEISFILEKELDAVYTSTTIKKTFDLDYANQVCLQLYASTIKNYLSQFPT